MKQLSIKARLTMLYGSLLTLMLALVLGSLFYISNNKITSTAKEHLQNRVIDSISLIDVKQGQYDFNNDLLQLKDGVYVSVYENDTLDLLYGRVPYRFNRNLAFQNDIIQKTTYEDIEYYVYDLQVPLKDANLTLRGILSITQEKESFYSVFKFALLIFPLLLILSLIIGYIFAKKALAPVSLITKRVRTIMEEDNLSNRVKLGNGNDEIYTMAQTFDALLDQAEDSLRREQQFTSDVSHELRTPLTVILMQCEQLLKTMDPKDSNYQSIVVLQKKALSMKQIISQLLLLSRADMGRAKIQCEVLNFSELSTLVIEELIPQAKKKDITIHSDIEEDLSIEADQTLCIRLWTNILNNAITYGKEHGNIYISVQQQDDFVCMRVQDDGIGIAQKDLPHIWDRFYQCEKSHTSTSNTGLGLSMVKWIIEAHHGNLKVSSELGIGTTFTFLLPIYKNNEKL